jgi:thiol:disulfide interchange protein DsbC
MSKISALLLASSLNLFAVNANDQLVLDFISGNIKQNPSVTLKDVKISEKIALPTVKGWEAIKVKMTVDVKGQGERSNTETMFRSGSVVAFDLYDMKTKSSLKDTLLPKAKTEHYRKDRIVAGNRSGNAKYKILVFSDPLCPFCRKTLPGLFDLANEHPKEVSLYYVDMPLTMLHPAAPTLVRASVALELQSHKNVIKDVYTSTFDAKEKDEAKVLKAFNKRFNTFLKVKDLHTKQVDMFMRINTQLSQSLAVRGTPTIFVNGERDSKLQKIEKIKREL